MKMRKMLAGATTLALSAIAAQAAIVVVTSDISSDTTWVSTNEYVLQGPGGASGVVRVLPGAKLTINAGTIVRGQPRSSTSTGIYDGGTLAVLRGGKIEAKGEANDPVIFTTAAVDNDQNGLPDGFVRTGTPGATGAAVVATQYSATGFVQFWDNSPKTSPKNPVTTGLWGGVIVLGRSQVNVATTATTANPTVADDSIDPTAIGNPASPYLYTKAIVEGLTDPDYAYGSDWATTQTVNGYTGLNYVDVDDNSGIIRYVSIRHGGIQLSADSEINGLTLAGVGRGTKVEYVEVWGNEDDGIEIFGGTVDLSHLAIFSTKDDGLDIDQGYQGKIQFVLVVGGSYMDKLLEWDGDDADESSAGKAAKANYEPRGSFEVRNVTLIGGVTANPSSTAGAGANIRRNASSKLYNVIIANIPGTRNSILDQSSFWNVVDYYTYGSGNVNSLSSATKGSTNADTDSPDFGTITFAADSVTGYAYLSSFTPSPDQTGSANSIYDFLVIPDGQSFFQTAEYRGAFAPGLTLATDLWTNGWTAASKSGAVHN